MHPRREEQHEPQRDHRLQPVRLEPRLVRREPRGKPPRTLSAKIVRESQKSSVAAASAPAYEVAIASGRRPQRRGADHEQRARHVHELRAREHADEHDGAEPARALDERADPVGCQRTRTGPSPSRPRAGRRRRRRARCAPSSSAGAPLDELALDLGDAVAGELVAREVHDADDQDQDRPGPVQIMPRWRTTSGATAPRLRVLGEADQRRARRPRCSGRAPTTPCPRTRARRRRSPPDAGPVSNSCSSVRSAIIDVAVTSDAAAPKLARKFDAAEQPHVERLVRARRPEADQLQHRPGDHEHREDQHADHERRLLVERRESRDRRMPSPITSPANDEQRERSDLLAADLPEVHAHVAAQSRLHAAGHEEHERAHEERAERGALQRVHQLRRAAASS